MTDRRSPLISVIVPCYNEEKTIRLFLNRFDEVASGMPDTAFELIFVDDGSVDGTLAILREISNVDKRIRYISFSKNFGKESAMLAGFEASAGDYIAVMDVDLQDPPELLPEMYEAVTEDGFDCVATRRATRKGEPPIRSWFAKIFYRLMNKISKVDIMDGARDFRLMKRQVVDAILSTKEYNRFSKGIFSWVGFHTKWISYDNMERVAGETKWSFWKLFLYSIDGIIAFSTAPLALSSVFGILFCLLSLLGVIFVVVRRILYSDPVAGWASTVCIVLFASGIQLFCTGVLGQYMAKTYLETKGRPLYIIKETTKNLYS